MFKFESWFRMIINQLVFERNARLSVSSFQNLKNIHTFCPRLNNMYLFWRKYSVSIHDLITYKHVACVVNPL